MRLGLSAGQPIPACSQLSSFALWQSNDIFGLSPPIAAGIVCAPIGVGGAAQRVARRGAHSGGSSRLESVRAAFR